eukprot:TRINITY_DN17466_c0_g1_i1.p1 TRINITY_DN17466_c0_g1~~TRINITY_DN17466_c0_g1_i1.p1  ORF type:complete len:269 (+),score=28.36 TRINITY_DN17466_c0_g1_i1:63-869(+)
MPIIESAVVTGCVGNGVLLTISDWCAQTIETGAKDDPERGKTQNYDYVRTARYAGIGVFLTGPLTMCRYMVLGNMFGFNAGGAVAVQKMVFNQLIFDPPETAVHLAGLEYLRSKDVNSAVEKLRADYTKVQIPSWGLAVPVNIATFTFFPEIWQQLVFQKSVGTCFNVYFSYVANLKVSTDEDRERKVDAAERHRVLIPRKRRLKLSTTRPVHPPDTLPLRDQKTTPRTFLGASLEPASTNSKLTPAPTQQRPHRVCSWRGIMAAVWR